jgi:hypothetical protein
MLVHAGKGRKFDPRDVVPREPEKANTVEIKSNNRRIRTEEQKK